MLSLQWGRFEAQDVAALFATIEREFGRLDLLFNNAGVFAPAVPVDELSFEDWAAVVNVNLTGRFCAPKVRSG